MAYKPKKTKCAKCDNWRLPGTGQKYCADHKLTIDGDSRNPWSQRARKYNMTVADLKAMHEAQDDRCAICGKAEPIEGRALAVDHDHRCCPGQETCGECVRGLLCSTCNRALGLLGDEPDVLRKAADYLESF